VSQLNSATQTVGQGRVGFFNPNVYFFAEFGIGLVTDITNGSNGDALSNAGIPGYFAGVLYDNCSGWGSINGLAFAEYYLLEPGGTGNPPGAFGGMTGTAQSTTAEFSWAASAGATGYFVVVQNQVTGAQITQVCTGTKFDVSGLTPKTYYAAGVWALNKNGYSEIDSGVILKTGK
jgi:hypothetical protein